MIVCIFLSSVVESYSHGGVQQLSALENIESSSAVGSVSTSKKMSILGKYDYEISENDIC